MTQPTATLADELLEAHVRHELSALKGAKLKKFLHREVEALLEHAQTITLARVISPDQVMNLIRRVVIDMELDAGIPELAAELATEVVNAPVQKETRLGDILSREQASAFVEEALELRHQRERVIIEIMAHPVYQELVSNVVYHGLVSYLYEDNLITRSVPGVGSMMKFGKKMANKAVPGLDETFERRIKAWLSESLPSLIVRSEQFLQKALSDDELRDTVMAAWVSLEDRSIAELQDGLGDVQLQEFVVLGYDFWLHYRQTPYFQGCAQAVVDGLYARYGDQPVMNLLNELGVTQEVIIAELEAVGVPLVDVLREEGYLEALLRRRLEPFYRSTAAKKLLAGVDG
ncbi:hypothetical protein [Marinobacter sp. VGCF2001]|uniref:hypothetical protein n=1 Tax=Marinobacter sp. VGCF2001 TaxID=3417189 RepID=UPI003CEB4F5D